MTLGSGLLPYVGFDDGEERVGVLPCVVNMRDIQFVGDWHKLPIDHPASDDESFFILGNMLHRFGDRAHDNGCRVIKRRVVTDDDVLAVGQRVLGQRQVRAFTHDHRVPLRHLLKVLQICRHVAQQSALFPDGVILCYCYNN